MPDGFRNSGTLRTHAEIAKIFCDRGEPITKGGVFMAERSALRKLRSDPVLMELFARTLDADRLNSRMHAVFVRDLEAAG